MKSDCTFFDDGPAPGTKIPYVLVDYYDGPVAGMMTCEPCAAHYGFEMLDWTSDHRYRLFMLRQLQAHDYERFKEIMGTADVRATLPETEYDAIKIIVRPVDKPDILIIWDNQADAVYQVVPVPEADSYKNWIPWMQDPEGVSWFEILNVKEFSRNRY